MSKYTKFKSNYILRKKHQNTSIGEIFERDWVTISETSSLESGKKPKYGYGNFLFTVNNTVSESKKISSGKWDIINATYDSVFDKKTEEDKYIGFTSNDLRDFSYFGSCVEYVRSAIEKIIVGFPANIKASSDVIYFTDRTYNEISDAKTNFSMYYFDNSFNIDMIHEDVVLDEYDNEMRFIELTWDRYNINGNDIKSYSIEHLDSEKCNDRKRIGIITITDMSDKIYTIYSYKYNDSIIYTTESAYIELRPNKNEFDNYFKSLEGLEKLLLNNNTNPIYTCKLITPIEEDNFYRYSVMSYTWPSINGIISVDSDMYFSYVDKLISLASKFDELWCDNIYRNMTHESIKNFDWSYNREYDDTDVEDNIDGGNKIKKLLRIYGRGFDDIKRYIDGIGFINSITYDGNNNVGNSALINRVKINGWDIINIDNGFSDKKVVFGKGPWYDSLNKNNIDQYHTNIEFMKRLMLSSKYIFKNKGTVCSIEMLLGMFGLKNGSDYIINEEYYRIEPIIDDGNHTQRKKIIKFNSDIKSYYGDSLGYYGIPLKDITYGNKQLIVPYLEKGAKYYNDEIYFQSKGGWGYDGNTYRETIPYLRFVNTINDLCNVNPNSVKIYDIFYVDDILGYISTTSETPTNFFYLENEYSQNGSSWKNISKEWGEISNPSTEDDKLKKYLYDKASYLNSISYNNKGNNPHIGYYNYDNGNEYILNLSNPFKYAYDNNLFNTVETSSEAIKIAFKTVVERYSTYKNDGIRYTNGKALKYNETNETEIITDSEWAFSDYIDIRNIDAFRINYGDKKFKTYGIDFYDKNKSKLPNIVYKYASNESDIEIVPSNIKESAYIRFSFSTKYIYDVKMYDSNGIIWTPETNGKVKIFNDESKYYYLNNKTVEIVIKSKSSSLRKYFDKIIYPYITQVIPSTSILIIKWD